MTKERKKGKANGLSQSPYMVSEYPDKLKKSNCIYLNGEVTHSSRGTYKVLMENQMESVCTARKMDHKRVGLLIGDNVTVEIPTEALSPGCTIKGRIVWRIRPAKTADRA